MGGEVVVGGRVSEMKLVFAVKKTARRALEFLRIKNARLEIFVVGNREMVNLKKEFLPENKGPANVIAFPAPKKFPFQGKFRPLGEIYLNKLFSKKEGEVERLIVHGILHLVGYEHDRKGDIVKMKNLEEKLWRQISSSA